MSYDDDDDEYDDDDLDEDQFDDGDSVEYECVNEGCAGSGMFYAAPSEWFEEEGLSAPKNCKRCRLWIKTQLKIGPIVAVCQFCGFSWPIYANLRIRHHRITGNWDVYWQANESLQLCHRCVEFPTRRLRLMRIAAERKYRDPSQRKTERDELVEVERNYANKATEILTSGAGGSSFSYRVPAEALFYYNVKTRPDKRNEHGDTQLSHIMKDKHNWGEEFGTSDPGEILALGARIARSTESHIRQFVNTRDPRRVVKYDTQQRIVVIIIGDETSPTGNRLETVYPKDPEVVLDDKIGDGEWK